MLSAKPWKLDAIGRLLASVFVCILAGSVFSAVLHFKSIETRTVFQFYGVAAAAIVALGATLLLLGKPLVRERLARHLTALLVCFYAGLLLGVVAQKLGGEFEPATLQVLIAICCFQGALLLLLPRFLREHQASWSEAFGFLNGWRRALFLGAVVAGLFLPVALALQYLSVKLILPWLHLDSQEQQVVQTLQMAGTWQARTALGFVTIILVPPAEEMLFRGILYPWIKQLGYPRLALIGTSLLFAVIHLNWATLLPLTVLAAALALLYDWTDNLLAPIVTHATFNGLNFMLLFLVDSADKFK